VPDIMVMAKGLGSGLPISAIAAPRAVMANWTLGSHGGTYGANAVACAAAEATVRVIREERLVENAATQGQALIEGLRTIQTEQPGIYDVRGLGLMAAVELAHADGSPDGKRAKAILHMCVEQGLLVLTCGPYDNVVRLIPPLIVTHEQVGDALAILRRAIEQTA
jgi:4-aminobutyrate aminotransferase